MRKDRVLRVMVVRNDITRTFVEWSDRWSGIKGWNVKGGCCGRAATGARRPAASV